MTKSRRLKARLILPVGKKAWLRSQKSASSCLIAIRGKERVDRRCDFAAVPEKTDGVGWWRGAI